MPNATAIRFLTGAHKIDGKKGNFVDAWVDYTSRLESICDTHGICARPCARTTPNATCWEDDGHTFNALDEVPRKRIDFVLVRGARAVDVAFVGSTPRDDGGKRVMASDHFGMVARLYVSKSLENYSLLLFFLFTLFVTIQVSY